jgi:hypothetical protein
MNDKRAREVRVIHATISQNVTSVIRDVEARFTASIKDWPLEDLLLYSAEPCLTDNQIRELFERGLRAIFARCAKLKKASRDAGLS